MPRIVRLINSSKCHLDHNHKESVLSSQSNSLLNLHREKQNTYVWPPTHAKAFHHSSNNNLTDDFKVDGLEGKQGELFLLYRHLKHYKIYHAEISRKSTNKTKGIRIPQDFSGELKTFCITLAFVDDGFWRLPQKSQLLPHNFDCVLKAPTYQNTISSS